MAVKWDSLTEKQKELIYEIGNGILEIAGLDKLVKIGGTLKKTRDLNETEKKDFKYKLIQEIKSVDNVDEEVLRTAAEVLKKEINSKPMIDYRGKESVLLNEICEKHSPSLSANRTVFRKLMEKILQFCSQNAEELISPQKLALATYDEATAIRAEVTEIKAEVTEIKAEFSKMNAVPASSTETEEKEVPLKHHNPDYEIKFFDKFFLEDEMPEDEGICSLHNVFVEPVLMKNTTSSLNAKLKKWSADYDKKSGKRSDAMYSVFLLYGKAGVGKSSYTAKLIYSQPFGKKWLALELRSCADRLKSADAWNSVKAVFGAGDDDAYKDSILILDGLDEVCVLYPDFNGKIFIENLQNENALKTKNIKILITSREGYFGDITQKNNLLMDTIQWTEEQVGEWCEQYYTVHPSRKKWAKKFIADYHKLSKGDDRRKIFCIPIILYLCCVREIDIGNIDISDEYSVVGIYERAFRTVTKHEHHLTTDERMKQADAHTLAVNWQYTKELAFRIFLDDKSLTVLGNDGIQDAKAHTKERFENCEPELDRYYALFPFASEKKQEGKPEGMEFAHKTVTDYFTAVKLYEDYFETALEQDDPVRALWEGLWRAFRYKRMPMDIMGYLAQVIRNRHKQDFDTYRRKFFDCYDEGVKAQTIWKVLDAPEYACKMEYSQLPQQVGLVFRNLTRLLHYLDYPKYEKKLEPAYTDGVSTFFQRGVQMDIWCDRWKGLRGADLCCADLSNAGLNDADLRGANLRRADLRGADLSGANLSYADLRYVFWSINQQLPFIKLWNTDLPQLDEAIENYEIRLFGPLVYSRKTGKLLKYNPKTNRAEEP